MDKLFNWKLDQETLLREALAEARQLGQLRQLCRRLKELLPNRLKNLKNQQSHGVSRSQAERLALCSIEYSQAIDEYLILYTRTLKSQIHYETSMMLVDARRSLRPFQGKIRR